MASNTCSACGSQWPEGFAFCGRCGRGLRPPEAQPIQPAAIPPPPTGPAPVAAVPTRTVRLLTLRSAGRDPQAYDVPLGRVSLGRRGEIAVQDDVQVDAVHLLLDRSPETLDVAGIPGRGGAFRRVRGSVMVQSGEVIFAGEQYLLVRSGDALPQADDLPADGPAEAFGTPLPPPRLHVTQLLAGGLPGRVASTEREQLTVGREGADLSFQQDRYMSGKHLHLQAAAAGQVQVVDVGSLNGTFVRMQQLPLRLVHGDELLVGSTLLRVEISET